MSTVVAHPSRKTASVAAGTDLLDALRAAGVAVDSPCGGKGTCGKCMVRIVEGEVASESHGTLPPAAIIEGYVLACRTKVGQTALTVEVPEPANMESGKFSDSDETHLVRSELLPKNADFDPLAVKWLLQVPPPQLESGMSDLDRLTRAVQRDWGQLPVHCPLDVIRVLADTLRAPEAMTGPAVLEAGCAAVTATLIREPHQYHVIRLEAGDTTTRHFGLAIDIGTTTIAVQLINLVRGQILATATDYNGQIPCGLDVISRINYARRPPAAAHLGELRTRVLETINRLIAQISALHGVAPHEICNAVVSGNTTMTHLFLGLIPEYIRLHPYAPTVLHSPYLSAGPIGLAIHPDSWVYLSPCVGSYVGGDITAGILCTDLALDTDELSLFVDIGTNGELVIGNRDFLVTTACSAGPAFEGAGIECGMRASVGAIEKVSIDAATGVARFSTVGNVPPRGICGSGMIDLAANLFTTGWIDPAGKFDRARTSSAIRLEGKRAKYVLAAADGAGDKEIYVTELDIDNIIRAKAAIYSACALLLHQLNLGFADLTHLYIAGGFGRFLNLEKAITIGLLPDIPREKFHYIGNSSLMGSYMVAVSQRFRERQLELAGRMTCLELSADPAYMDQYTGALFLPHTDPARFPSVRRQAVPA